MYIRTRFTLCKLFSAKSHSHDIFSTHFQSLFLIAVIDPDQNVGQSESENFNIQMQVGMHFIEVIRDWKMLRYSASLLTQRELFH